MYSPARLAASVEAELFDPPRASAATSSPPQTGQVGGASHDTGLTVRSPAVAVLPDETTAFEGQLDDAIKAAVTHGARRLEDVIAAVPGAFPSAVAERLDRLGLLSRLPRQTDEKLHPQPEPELHPLDYEWYFTPQADSRLTEELRLWPDPIACLGTPTVAMAVQHPPQVLSARFDHLKSSVGNTESLPVTVRDAKPAFHQPLQGTLPHTRAGDASKQEGGRWQDLLRNEVQQG